MINVTLEKHTDIITEDDEYSNKISTIINQLEHLLESANSLKQDKEITLNCLLRIC